MSDPVIQIDKDAEYIFGPVRIKGELVLNLDDASRRELEDLIGYKFEDATISKPMLDLVYDGSDRLKIVKDRN